ncbi:hypothetical protein ABZ622_24785 [Streptomyces sp. NPDC007164]|uniref:hypothetical protein n=1 Tax=Streptomyces sp. NPDC007164 TaxID=3156918 RepID=UPI00340A57AD
MRAAPGRCVGGSQDGHPLEIAGHVLGTDLDTSALDEQVAALTAAVATVAPPPSEVRPDTTVRPTAFITWTAGGAAGGLVHWFAPQLSDAVSGLVVALFACIVIERTTGGRPASLAQ